MRAKVGDRYVLEELIARGWQLGGEGSGHLLALDKHTTGDGIVSSLLALAGGDSRSGRSLAALLEPVQLFPQVLLNVRLTQRVVEWQSRAGTRAGCEIAEVRARTGCECRQGADTSVRHRADRARDGRGTR